MDQPNEPEVAKPKTKKKKQLSLSKRFYKASDDFKVKVENYQKIRDRLPPNKQEETDKKIEQIWAKIHDTKLSIVMIDEARKYDRYRARKNRT